MKNLLLVLLVLPFIGFGQNVNIPDANFKKYLIDNTAINTNRDKEIQVSEASAFNSEIDCFMMDISNLKGIEAFTTLTSLNCYGNQLTSLDVSKNTALTQLFFGSNQLTSLDVSQNNALTSLACNENQLTSLDVSKNTALTYLQCDENQLTSLDLSKNTALTQLFCDGNQFDCDALLRKYGLIIGTPIKIGNLEVAQNTFRKEMNWDDAVDACRALGSGWRLPTKNELNLMYLNKDEIGGFTNWRSWWSSTEYYELNAWYQDFDDGGQNKKLKDYLGCGVCAVRSFLPMAGFGQNVNIPDANFKAYLVYNAEINTNGDNEIQVSEASAFNGEIDCWNINISNLKGIEAFTALTGLTCNENQLTSLDVSKNTALTWLTCVSNQLTSLDLSKNTALTSLNCEGNQLKSLDVSQNTALTHLDCEGNQLTSLDVSQNTALTHLGCEGNQFNCDALKSKYGLD